MPALYTPSVDSTVSLLAATGPGNMAPHYRVQTRTDRDDQQWKLVASFSELSLAQICLDRLRRSGKAGRLIAYRRVPTAA